MSIANRILSSSRDSTYFRRFSETSRPRAIEAAVRLYSAECIVCGTDGTEFGCEWTSKAPAEAQIGEDAHAKILDRNAAAMMSRLTMVAQRETAAA
jgi:hypothetical protein